MEERKLPPPDIDLYDDPKTLYECVKNAILAFEEKESFLIKEDLGERCICGKFAQYLEREIHNIKKYELFDVDIEYDKGYQGDHAKSKRLKYLAAGDREETEHRIQPDIIAHVRECDEIRGYYNLVCIEMKKKKDYNVNKIDADEERLQKLTRDDYGFGYRIGLMIIADTVCEKYTVEDNRGLKIKSIYVNGECKLEEEL